MANNRMWLQIKDQPEKKILLAKYYPSTGWYIFHTERELNEWFNENFNEPSMFGRIDLELVFQETNNKRSNTGIILKALDNAINENYEGKQNDTIKNTTEAGEENSSQSPTTPGISETESRQTTTAENGQ